MSRVVPEGADLETDAGLRPGWREFMAAAIAFVIIFAGIVAWSRFGPDLSKQIAGLVEYALSAILGLGAFAVAVAARIRRVQPFGVHRVAGSWLAIGAVSGLGTFAVGLLVSVGYITLSGDQRVIQGDYQASAGAGPLFLIGTLLLGSVATPIGEEFLWRGVLANVLLRHLPGWIAVIGSAALFAVAHGINAVAPTAFVVGLATVLLFRRTRSVWPGVCLHAVHNSLSTFFPLAIAALS
ncbi:CPBP family intramembrane glutamic endopeptidase [Microlunatus soli]|uniref:CAAX prenyl protease 2/Lysostaphin resistance protein A-like domain-containing protein n=1 Tax=Microlunatus soli TaxID=630515 RepID=A0A1H2AAE2_9ACTN|nr:type II CAAX endopeptidase family protein [Microlunatus soli]SDT42732.1 hypothetical protein SAMN04489812_5778 [Microlunatus soli]